MRHILSDKVQVKEIKKGSDTMEKKKFENNVIVAVFKVESEGFQALSEIRQAAGGESYLVSAAALVKKENGACFFLDGFDTGVDTANDTVIGGLIGMTVGLLAGPFGMLLGGSYGALVGMIADSGEAALGVSMLDQIAGKLDDGMVALIALACEESPEALDNRLSAFDSVIARFDAAVVADEVGKAYEAQAENARLARAELRRDTFEELHRELSDSWKEGSESFKSDMSFTVAAIKELNAERKAKKQAKKEKRAEAFEENSELLKEGFTK